MVTRFYEDGVNARNWKVVADLLAPDFTHNGQRLGPDGQRRSLETLYAAFPDVRVTLDDTVFASETVVVRMTDSSRSHANRAKLRRRYSVLLRVKPARRRSAR